MNCTGCKFCGRCNIRFGSSVCREAREIVAEKS